jgi:hypothetical protein
MATVVWRDGSFGVAGVGLTLSAAGTTAVPRWAGAGGRPSRLYHHCNISDEGRWTIAGKRMPPPGLAAAAPRRQTALAPRCRV